MKSSKSILFISMLLVSAWVGAQTFDPWGVFPEETPHQTCAAIVYANKAVEKSDRPLMIKPDTKGTLSVATVKMSEAGTALMDPIAFRVAIKDHKTQTLWMATDQVYHDEVDLAELLPFCGQGDQLVFMPVDRRYGLLAQAIVVGDGC